MTHNVIISCKMCDKKVNLRIQMGYFDIPFNFHCPECETSISGTALLKDYDAIKLSKGVPFLKLDNATEITTGENINRIHCVELSAEFPTRKMYLRDMTVYKPTSFLKYSDNREETYSVMRFYDQYHENFDRISKYYELFFNGKEKILTKKLKQELHNLNFKLGITEISNNLDAYLILHQLLIITTGITFTLEKGCLSTYTDLSQRILLNENLPKKMEFLNEIEPRINSIEAKALEIIRDFANIYTQLIPVIVLRNNENLLKIDKEKDGIMTANFDELSNFYAKSYEYILNNIDIIIALNNIEGRNDYRITCKKDKTYNDILKTKNKFERLNFLERDGAYSREINFLKNRIRNAIQHFDHDIDFATQKITFTDKYGGKTKKEIIYLVDFAMMCAENFSMIIYLLEIIYNFRKLNFLTEGNSVNNTFVDGFSKHLINRVNKATETREEKDMIKIKKNVNETKKKIGRNEKCTCGSLLKYKKCCGT